jgi:hypothetical protein
MRIAVTGMPPPPLLSLFPCISRCSREDVLVNIIFTTSLMLRDLQEVDAEWAARLEEAHAAAAAAKDGVRRELDAQIEAITRRLNELSSAEARRERRRTELAEEVAFSLSNALTHCVPHFSCTDSLFSSAIALDIFSYMLCFTAALKQRMYEEKKRGMKGRSAAQLCDGHSIHSGQEL